MTADLSAVLADMRARADATRHRFCVQDVPALLGAVEAVLALADRLEREAAEHDSKFMASDDPMVYTAQSVLVVAKARAADDLRRAITEHLAPEEGR